MKYDRLAVVQGIIDLAYSALILGVGAYVFRRQLRDALARQRDEFETRRAEIIDRKRRIDSRRGFVAYLRDRGIEPTTRDLTEESV